MPPLETCEIPGSASDLSPGKIVYVIDDERDVRVSLVMLLRTFGIEARPFVGAGDFLADLPNLKPGCVITDVLMPETSGLALLAELRERGCGWPVVVITGQGDVTTAVAAMKLGAVEFLEKPFQPAALSETIDGAAAQLATIVARDVERDAARRRVTSLTVRQRSVLEGVEQGQSNKQIAMRLGLSTRTVEMHRAAMMRCLGVENTRELLAMLAAAGRLLSGSEHPSSDAGGLQR